MKKYTLFRHLGKRAVNKLNLSTIWRNHIRRFRGPRKLGYCTAADLRALAVEKELAAQQRRGAADQLYADCLEADAKQLRALAGEMDVAFSLKTEMAPDSAGVRSGLVSLSDRFESSSGI